MDPKYIEQMPNLIKSRFDFQWLGVGIDQWSVGCCGCNMLRYGLKLYDEPIYDGLHGVHRDIYRAMAEANVWIFFLVMRMLYSFSYSAWNSGKTLSEAADIVHETYNDQRLKAEANRLWQALWPGMCRDEGKPWEEHDQAKCDLEFENFPNSAVLKSKGPKMTICGWMSYFRGYEHWDPLHNRRTFVLLLVCWAKRLATGSLATMNLLSIRVEKMFEKAEVGMTKKVQEANTKALKQ